MLTTWLSGLGTKLADNWVSKTLSPALLFWIAGVAAILLAPGGDQRERDLEQAFNGAAPTLQVAALVAGLALVTLSEQFSKALSLAVTRALEGYWPRLASPIRRLLVYVAASRYRKARDRWNHLNKQMEEHGVASLSADERAKYTALELQLHRAPTDDALRMPTRFGNVMRAAEARIAGWYGLDPVLCWPSFWLVLPDGAKTEIADARTALDARIGAWFWAVAYCLWTPVLYAISPSPSGLWLFAPLVIGTMLAFVAYYGWLVPAAETYAGLLEAVFGLYRSKLYEAYSDEAGKIKQMPGVVGEQDIGASLTLLIWRGLPSPKLAEPGGNKAGADVGQRPD
jgi:hypothetical protein